MNKLSVSLTTIRIALGLVTIASALYKIIESGDAKSYLAVFLPFKVSQTQTVLIGCVQLLVGIFVAIGLWRRVTYPLGALVHGVAVLATYRQIMKPLEQQFHLYLGNLTLLLVFVFLCLHWREDKWLTVD